MSIEISNSLWNLPEDVKSCYMKARKAEKDGKYREALSYLSKAESLYQYKYNNKPGHYPNEPSPQWKQLFKDEKRMVYHVRGPPKSDDRIYLFKDFSPTGKVQPPKGSHYSAVRYGDLMYRYGGCGLLLENFSDDLYA